MACRSTRMALPVLIVPLLLAAACSSSKNNTGNAPASASVAASATGVSVTVAAPSPAVPPLASPSAVRVAVTPAVSALVSPTPAVIAGASPSAAALQQQLAAAALTASDLPSGYTTLAGPDTTTPLPGETAGYQQVFTKLALPEAAVIVDGLQGYRDTASAQAAMANLRNGLQQLNQSLGLSLTPTSSTVQVGQDTQTYQATLSVQGVSLNGYLIAWRHGRLGATLLMAGTSGTAPSSPTDVAQLAQKQDAKLQTVAQ